MDLKFCMWSSYYIDLSPEEAVLELEKSGVNYSEFSDEHGVMLLKRSSDVVKTGREFKKFAEDHHVAFPQGHLWLDIHLVEDPNAVEMLKKWIELFEAIGIKNMVLHLDACDFHKDLTNQQKLDLNAEKLIQIKDFIKNKDISICLENLIRFTPCVEDLLYVLAKVDDDRHFGITLDTGHLNLVKESSNTQAEFIEKAGKNLKALHIADNEGINFNDQHMIPFGKGNVNFKEVIEGLRKIDFNGVFNYEVPGERKAPLEIRNAKIQYIKNCFNYMKGNY